MSPPSLDRVRRDGKTEAQAQAEQEARLNEYNISDSPTNTPLHQGQGSETVVAEDVNSIASKPTGDNGASNKRKHSDTFTVGTIILIPSQTRGDTTTRKSQRTRQKASRPYDDLLDIEQSSPSKKRKTSVASTNSTSSESQELSLGTKKAKQPEQRDSNVTLALKLSSSSVPSERPPIMLYLGKGKGKRVSEDELTHGKERETKRAKTTSAAADPFTHAEKAANIEPNIPDSTSVESSVPDENAHSANKVSDEAPNVDRQRGSGRETAQESVRKQALPFQGSTNGHGSSIEKPPGATLSVPWRCANRSCSTGQTWFARDGKEGVGRKVISPFFGRNKRQTNYVDNEVWHTFCRKCYQRTNYSARKEGDRAVLENDVGNIDAQTCRLKLWRPQARFHVQLWSAAQKRLAAYYEELGRNGGDKPKAAETVTPTSKKSRKGKDVDISYDQKFPIEQMIVFKDNFTGAGCTYDDLDAITAWIRRQSANGSLSCMPPMEFLINDVADNETINDTAANYEKWLQHTIQLASAATESSGDDGVSESNAAAPEDNGMVMRSVEIDESDDGEDTNGAAEQREPATETSYNLRRETTVKGTSSFATTTSPGKGSKKEQGSPSGSPDWEMPPMQSVRSLRGRQSVLVGGRTLAELGDLYTSMKA